MISFCCFHQLKSELILASINKMGMVFFEGDDAEVIRVLDQVILLGDGKNSVCEIS